MNVPEERDAPPRYVPRRVELFGRAVFHG